MKALIALTALVLLAGCNTPSGPPVPTPSRQNLGGGYWVFSFWATGPDGARIPCMQSYNGGLSCGWPAR